MEITDDNFNKIGKDSSIFGNNYEYPKDKNEVYIFSKSLFDFIKDIETVRNQMEHGQKGYYKNIFETLFPEIEKLFGALIRSGWKTFYYDNGEIVDKYRVKEDFDKLVCFLVLSIPMVEKNVKKCFDQYVKALDISRQFKELERERECKEMIREMRIESLKRYRKKLKKYNNGNNRITVNGKVYNTYTVPEKLKPAIEGLIILRNKNKFIKESVK